MFQKRAYAGSLQTSGAISFFSSPLPLLRRMVSSPQFLELVSSFNLESEADAERFVELARSVEILIYPLENLEQSCQLLHYCGTLFSKASSSASRRIWAGILTIWLWKLGGLAGSAEVNIPCWQRSVALLFEVTVSTLNQTKKRDVVIFLPLLTAILSCARKELFLKKWHLVVDGELLTRLSCKQFSLQAFVCIQKLLSVYLSRIKESYSDTHTKLFLVLKALYCSQPSPSPFWPPNLPFKSHIRFLELVGLSRCELVFNMIIESNLVRKSHSGKNLFFQRLFNMAASSFDAGPKNDGLFSSLAKEISYLTRSFICLSSFIRILKNLLQPCISPVEYYPELSQAWAEATDSFSFSHIDFSIDERIIKTYPQLYFPSSRAFHLSKLFDILKGHYGACRTYLFSRLTSESLPDELIAGVFKIQESNNLEFKTYANNLFKSWIFIVCKSIPWSFMHSLQNPSTYPESVVSSMFDILIYQACLWDEVDHISLENLEAVILVKGLEFFSCQIDRVQDQLENSPQSTKIAKILSLILESCYESYPTKLLLLRIHLWLAKGEFEKAEIILQSFKSISPFCKLRMVMNEKIAVDDLSVFWRRLLQLNMISDETVCFLYDYYCSCLKNLKFNSPFTCLQDSLLSLFDVLCIIKRDPLTFIIDALEVRAIKAPLASPRTSLVSLFTSNAIQSSSRNINFPGFQYVLDCESVCSFLDLEHRSKLFDSIAKLAPNTLLLLLNHLLATENAVIFESKATGIKLTSFQLQWLFDYVNILYSSCYNYWDCCRYVPPLLAWYMKYWTGGLSLPNKLRITVSSLISRIFATLPSSSPSPASSSSYYIDNISSWLDEEPDTAKFEVLRGQLLDFLLDPFISKGLLLEEQEVVAKLCKTLPQYSSIKSSRRWRVSRSHGSLDKIVVPDFVAETADPGSNTPTSTAKSNIAVSDLHVISPKFSSNINSVASQLCSYGTLTYGISNSPLSRRRTFTTLRPSVSAPVDFAATDPSQTVSVSCDLPAFQFPERPLYSIEAKNLLTCLEWLDEAWFSWIPECLISPNKQHAAVGILGFRNLLNNVSIETDVNDDSLNAWEWSNETLWNLKKFRMSSKSESERMAIESLLSSLLQAVIDALNDCYCKFKNEKTEDSVFSILNPLLIPKTRNYFPFLSSFLVLFQALDGDILLSLPIRKLSKDGVGLILDFVAHVFAKAANANITEKPKTLQNLSKCIKMLAPDLRCLQSFTFFWILTEFVYWVPYKYSGASPSSELALLSEDISFLQFLLVELLSSCRCFNVKSKSIIFHMLYISSLVLSSDKNLSIEVILTCSDLSIFIDERILDLWSECIALLPAQDLFIWMASAIDSRRSFRLFCLVLLIVKYCSRKLIVEKPISALAEFIGCTVGFPEMAAEHFCLCYPWLHAVGDPGEMLFNQAFIRNNFEATVDLGTPFSAYNHEFFDLQHIIYCICVAGLGPHPDLFLPSLRFLLDRNETALKRVALFAIQSSSFDLSLSLLNFGRFFQIEKFKASLVILSSLRKYLRNDKSFSSPEVGYVVLHNIIISAKKKEELLITYFWIREIDTLLSHLSSIVASLYASEENGSSLLLDLGFACLEELIDISFAELNGGLPAHSHVMFIDKLFKFYVSLNQAASLPPKYRILLLTFVLRSKSKVACFQFQEYVIKKIAEDLVCGPFFPFDLLEFLGDATMLTVIFDLLSQLFADLFFISKAKHFSSLDNAKYSNFSFLCTITYLMFFFALRYSIRDDIIACVDVNFELLLQSVPVTSVNFLSDVQCFVEGLQESCNSDIQKAIGLLTTEFRASDLILVVGQVMRRTLPLSLLDKLCTFLLKCFYDSNLPLKTIAYELLLDLTTASKYPGLPIAFPFPHLYKMAVTSFGCPSKLSANIASWASRC